MHGKTNRGINISIGKIKIRCGLNVAVVYDSCDYALIAFALKFYMFPYRLRECDLPLLLERCIILED